MNLFAINLIDRGRAASPRIVEPGHILQVLDVTNYRRLLDMDAMREATDEEVKVAKALDRLHRDESFGQAAADEKAAAAKASKTLV